MHQMRISPRISSGTLVVAVLLGVLVLPRPSVARDWDLARDFNVDNNDGADTWQYFRASDGHLDGSYDRLPHFEKNSPVDRDSAPGVRPDGRPFPLLPRM